MLIVPFGYLAMKSTDPLERAFAGLFIASFVSIAVALIALCGRDHTGHARVADAAPLRFLPSRAVVVPLTLASALWASASCIAVLSWAIGGIAPLSAGSARGAVVIALIITGGFVLLGWRILWLVQRSGIVLDEQGVSWQTPLGCRRIPWNELDRPEMLVRPGGSPARLKLVNGSGTTLGSDNSTPDAYVLVEAIEYFRTHPEERHKTNDPMTALSAFAEIVR